MHWWQPAGQSSNTSWVNRINKQAVWEGQDLAKEERFDPLKESCMLSCCGWWGLLVRGGLKPAADEEHYPVMYPAPQGYSGSASDDLHSQYLLQVKLRFDSNCPQLISHLSCLWTSFIARLWSSSASTLFNVVLLTSVPLPTGLF